MSLHQFAIDGRKRLLISPSKTEPGKVLLQVLDSARDVLLTCSLDAATAAVVSQAFELEAAAAELAAAVAAEGAATSLGALKTLYDNREKYEPRIDALCDCKASRHVGPYKPPCVCHEGRLSCMRSGLPVLSALPVVDVPQVGV